MKPHDPWFHHDPWFGQSWIVFVSYEYAERCRVCVRLLSAAQTGVYR